MKTTPEERQQIIDAFNAMDPATDDRYAKVAKQFNRATSTAFRIIKESQLTANKVKYFNPKDFQF
jgi:hypothetical protein